MAQPCLSGIITPSNAQDEGVITDGSYPLHPKQPIPLELPRLEWSTVGDRRPITQAVRTLTDLLRMRGKTVRRTDVYISICKAFGLGSIAHLPVRHVPDVLDYVENLIVAEREALQRKGNVAAQKAVKTAREKAQEKPSAVPASPPKARPASEEEQKTLEESLNDAVRNFQRIVETFTDGASQTIRQVQGLAEERYAPRAELGAAKDALVREFVRDSVRSAFASMDAAMAMSRAARDALWALHSGLKASK